MKRTEPTIPLHKWQPGQYVPSHQTDIRKTIANALRKQAPAQQVAA